VVEEEGAQEVAHLHPASVVRGVHVSWVEDKARVAPGGQLPGMT
jgi:hypothetical protein